MVLSRLSLLAPSVEMIGPVKPATISALATVAVLPSVLLVITASGFEATMLAAWLDQELKVIGSRTTWPRVPPAASTAVLVPARLASTAGEIRPSKAIFLPESEPPNSDLRPLATPAPTPVASGLVEKKYGMVSTPVTM